MAESIQNYLNKGKTPKVKYKRNVWEYVEPEKEVVETPNPIKNYVAPLANNSSDDGGEHGPGTTISGTPIQTYQASYSSPQEAWQAGKAGIQNSYWGTVQDAASTPDNQKSQDYLNSYVQNVMTNPINLGPQAPGLLGLALHHSGLTHNKHGGVSQNTQDAIYGLESSGNLYSDDNSSGYQGQGLTQQQNLSDAHAATTYGDWSGWDDNSTAASVNNTDTTSTAEDYNDSTDSGGK